MTACPSQHGRSYRSLRALLSAALFLRAGSALTAEDPWGGNAAAGKNQIAVCAACHGEHGEAAGSSFPKLAGQHAAYIAERLHHFKFDVPANPIMHAMSLPLSEQDMRNISAYFASQPVHPDPNDGMDQAGAKLYQHGDLARGIPACQACHASDGSGNPGAPYPALRGQHADYLAQQLKGWQAAAADPNKPPRNQIMPLIAKRLSAADVTALSHYLATLPPP